MGENKKKRTSVNIFKETSDMPGLYGLFETFLRKFRTLAFAAMLSPVILLAAGIMGLALTPGVYVFSFIYDYTSAWPTPLHYMSIGFAIMLAYLCYGFSLLFIVPAFNFLLPLKLKAWRGIWFSLQSVPWFIHNALTYIVRYTFLEFMTPSPLNVLFYKMMGMKIGKGVVINSTNISDPCLITLGDYVTIGGSAHIMAHYGQKGYLILAPVIIDDYSTIGLKSSVMGGARIGKNCMVKPHVAVLPKTVLPDGESL